jgi:hypothetical protein
LSGTGEPWLPQDIENIGIPYNSSPVVTIESKEQVKYTNKFIFPMPKNDPATGLMTVDAMDYSIYNANKLFPENPVKLEKPFIMRYIKISHLCVSPFQFNPVSRELILNKKIIVKIVFNTDKNVLTAKVNDPFTDDFINYSVLNSSVARNWTAKSSNMTAKKIQSTNYWYNPSNEYYKLYLKEKGVYRITYQDLYNAGFRGTNMPDSSIAIFNSGIEIPLYVVDKDSNKLFNQGDYIEFVGAPAPSSPNASLNIYNLSNVYWFTFKNDSAGLRYKEVDATPAIWEREYSTALETFHFEQDSIYERLGRALDDQRDYWFWGKAGVYGENMLSSFLKHFNGFPDIVQDSSLYSIKVDMHGITANPSCANEHKAYIYLSDKLIDTVSWGSGSQTRYTYEKRVAAKDSIPLYPLGNTFVVKVTGENCNIGGVKSDEIRINWFEIAYWKYLRAVGNNNLVFSTPPNAFGIYRYWTWQWKDSLVHVFIPNDKKLVTKATWNENYEKAYLFADTVFSPKEYYCKSVDFYKTVDSVVKNINSDLRNLANAADYIIIAHPKFRTIAEQLKAFRETTPLDSNVTNPRVKIVYIQDIYNEFSFGLLDPYALKYFAQYSFENWAGNAPSYITLLGDMSWDYRHLIPESRENFIPSLPFFMSTYGQCVSDNNIVTVAGDDYIPDMVIGRISIETVDEGQIVLNKTKNYPADNSKNWKRNVTLVSSGVSLEDENTMQFNEASVRLETNYIKPVGYKTTKIMRYPNKPEHMQYLGGGAEIRKAIDDGTVLLNYYGHGGGYQWDLTFLNDDIYQLNNPLRLPVISSITCYTAHFDNQDVFGEQFLKIPNKGCVGFWGSSGLTSWGSGTPLDERLFYYIFTKKEHNIGKAILKAKADAGYGTQEQAAALVYLGEPALTLALPTKTDFNIPSDGISASKDKLLKGDTVSIKIILDNTGVVFNDSVTVEISAASADTSYSIGTIKKGPFCLSDSCFVSWIPAKGGQYTLTAKINENNAVPEEDHSDNIATEQFMVYDISEPNYYSPIDGYLSKSGKIDFDASDIGYYVNMQFKYEIEIDTIQNFLSPFTIKSGPIIPEDGMLKWTSPELGKASYFWRSRIFDGSNYGPWSSAKSFSVGDSSFQGYMAKDCILKQFTTNNINYLDSAKCLVLNTMQLPPRPNEAHFLGDLPLDSSNAVYDTTGMTTTTTDGKYIYIANNSYFAATDYNPNGMSKIYKVGTGFGGTQKGKFYGEIPNFYNPISLDIVYFSDGFIYATTHEPDKLVKINPETGDTATIVIPEGLMRWDDSRVKPGGFYVAADSNYFYNLALIDSLGNYVYTLRTLDPKRGWAKVKPDMRLFGVSYTAFSNFMIADGYVYTFEIYSCAVKKYRLADGAFVDEWLANVGPTPCRYYGWCYDVKNDKVYASSFRRSGKQTVSLFAGRYIDASGTIISKDIGPASKWNNLSYHIDKANGNGKYSAVLFGYNSSKKSWDTLSAVIPQLVSLDTINALKYNYLRVQYTLTDSSLSINNPINLKSMSISYQPLTELLLNRKNFVFTPDTTLQGFSNIMSLKVVNLSKTKADSVNVKFILGKDSLYYQTYVNMPADTVIELKKEINTRDFAPATTYKITAEAKPPANCPEYFIFNNIIDNRFYVSRDSVKPEYKITIDGKEIINGDVVSANPTIEISLKDNSPLPLKSEYFTLVMNNIPIEVVGADDTSKTKPKFSYTPYPNSEAKIVWTPKLSDGSYVLEVLAKDASGNFFDSTSSKTVFSVYNNFDLVNVLNYPNPFKNDTYFTFELRGDYKKIEECRIRIFTVAGRLIKEISVPAGKLQSGFNKIYWDGKDQDGDNIANGTYLYKMIIKNDGKTKDITQKLSKVK